MIEGEYDVCIDDRHFPQSINADWVSARVDAISHSSESIDEDDDGDHNTQRLVDNLYFMVLTYIAAGNCEDPQACAKAALQCCMINYNRQ